jgi:ERCC4-type nuclease
MTSKLNAIAAELSKSVVDGQSYKDTTQHIKAIAAASLARTESAEAKAEETSKQQQTMLQKMEGMGKTNIIMLVAVLAVAVLLVVYISKR